VAVAAEHPHPQLNSPDHRGGRSSARSRTARAGTRSS